MVFPHTLAIAALAAVTLAGCSSPPPVVQPVEVRPHYANAQAVLSTTLDPKSPRVTDRRLSGAWRVDDRGLPSYQERNELGHAALARYNRDTLQRMQAGQKPAESRRAAAADMPAAGDH